MIAPRSYCLDTCLYEAKNANLVHDSGFETDPIVLVQSALLMSSWHLINAGLPRVWHWTGFTIGLTPDVGLHLGGERLLPASGAS